MEIGTGIFLAGTALALVLLYLGTRDRWRWGRIVVWLVGGFIAFGVLVGGGIYLYDEMTPDPWDPVRKSELAGVQLLHGKADVRFHRGKALSEDSDTWAYSEDDYSLLVFFGDGLVETVLMSPKRTTAAASLFGIYEGDSIKRVVEKLGEPGSFKSSPDGTQRIYNYPELNSFFLLGAGKVEGFGIYIPSKGGLEFNAEPQAE